MYTLHFYAGTHKDNIRNKLTTARAAGTPVFISEFSICDASGNGGIDYTSADAWKKLINETNVSYCGWSFANKNETSALIKPSCSSTDCFTDNDLSETGVWLKGLISGH
jgi:endoglucanase